MGLRAACRHTKISHDQVIALASQITNELINSQVQEMSTTQLGEMVMKYLQALDPIAYIRFACVYRRFKDLMELEEAIKTIQSKDETNLAEFKFYYTLKAATRRLKMATEKSGYREIQKAFGRDAETA